MERGYAVRALRRKDSRNDEFEFIYKTRLQDAGKAAFPGKLEWVYGDVLDVPSLEEGMQGCNHVYHCAAVVSFFPKDRERMFRVNVEGTANMVNSALQTGIQTFTHISSIAAIGRRKSGEQIDEETRWENSSNNSNYSISKYRAELEVWRGMEEGLRVVVVNPGVIIGTGDYAKGSAHLIQSIWKGLPFFSRGVNGYVDVQDVAEAAIQLTEQQKTGKRYILVSENLPLKTFFEWTALALHKKAPYIEVNKWLSEIAWRVMALKRLFISGGISITKETARSAMNQYYYSNKRIREEIGFEFLPMRESIQRACTHFLEKQKQR